MSQDALLIESLRTEVNARLGPWVDGKGREHPPIQSCLIVLPSHAARLLALAERGLQALIEEVGND